MVDYRISKEYTEGNIPLPQANMVGTIIVRVSTVARPLLRLI